MSEQAPHIDTANDKIHLLENFIRSHSLQEEIISEIGDRQNRESNIILFEVPDQDSTDTDTD